MNPITFPGLGLTFQLERVAFTVFGHNIYWYGIIIACGFLLAVSFCCRQARHYGIRQDDLIDMLFFAVPLCIIGARLYYIIFYFSFFQKEVDGKLVPNFGQMIAIWDGGLAIYGAVIMAVLVAAVFCKVKRIKFGAMADLGCFGLLIGQAVGRWGNFVNQEAFGGPTGLPWRMGLTVNGTYMEVHPTFLYESAWNVLGFFLLWYVAKHWRKFDGQIFLGYVVWYGFGRGIIEGLRTDSLYFFGLKLFGMPIRTSQVLGFASALAAAVFLAWRLLRGTRPEELYVNQARAAKAARKAAQPPEEKEER